MLGANKIENDIYIHYQSQKRHVDRERGKEREEREKERRREGG